MTAHEEAPCILILDLSVENSITERSVMLSLPPDTPSPRVYRATQFGAERAPRGNPSDERTWRAWTRAVDAMVSRMWADLGDDAEVAHYYVAGRAALPIFAYLGMKLGKQARVTACNMRRDGTWDVVPLRCPPRAAAAAKAAPEQSGASEHGRFFNLVKGLRRDDPHDATGTVAVFVSTQRDLERSLIQTFAKSCAVPLAGIVTIRARPHDGDPQARALLTAGDGPRAAAQLEECFTTIKDAYPHHEGIMVFIAGPASLALMAGWAINPHMYVPVYLPNFAGRAYEPAIEAPWPLVSGGTPRFLIATANPPGGQGERLDTERELREVLRSLTSEVEPSRCEVHICPAATAEDITSALLDFRPHVFHFSGHGEREALVLAREDGDEHLVLADWLRRTIEAVGADLHLIVLNACHSQLQAQALVELADCVIGTRRAIADEAAWLFARRFYAALVRGCSIHRAYELGKAEVASELELDPEIFVMPPRDDRDPKQIRLFSPADRARR